MSYKRKNQLKPIKTFKQLKTLYQHNFDTWVSRDRLENTHLFSNRNSLWDAYKYDEYLAATGYTPSDVGCPDEDYPPVMILVKRSRTSRKYLFYDTELEIMFNSGLCDIDVFKEVNEKWLKAHSHSKTKKTLN